MVFGKTLQKTLLCLFFVYGGMFVFSSVFVFVVFIFWLFLLGWVKLVHWIGKYFVYLAKCSGTDG